MREDRTNRSPSHTLVKEEESDFRQRLPKMAVFQKSTEMVYGILKPDGCEIRVNSPFIRFLLALSPGGGGKKLFTALGIIGLGSSLRCLL
ncbi:MAG: hypothetical protein N3E47_05365 [Candidatus Bathyarchaeota archaeon]|nr:hypothetical protein [Candidatus Bathyarchaeota archaeon]